MLTIMKKINDPTTVVSIDNVLIVAIGMGESIAIRSENLEYVQSVKQAVALSTLVTLIPLTKEVEASFDSNVGILAALMSANPGRTIIVEIPEETEKFLEKLRGPYIEGAVY